MSMLHPWSQMESTAKLAPIEILCVVDLHGLNALLSSMATEEYPVELLIDGALYLIAVADLSLIHI